MIHTSLKCKNFLQLQLIKLQFKQIVYNPILGFGNNNSMFRNFLYYTHSRDINVKLQGATLYTTFAYLRFIDY